MAGSGQEGLSLQFADLSLSPRVLQKEQEAFWGSLYKDVHLISESSILLHDCLLKHMNLGTLDTHCTEVQLGKVGWPSRMPFQNQAVPSLAYHGQGVRGIESIRGLWCEMVALMLRWGESRRQGLETGLWLGSNL